MTGLGAFGGGTFWATAGTEGDFHSGGTVKCDGLLLTGGGLLLTGGGLLLTGGGLLLTGGGLL